MPLDLQSKLTADTLYYGEFTSSSLGHVVVTIDKQPEPTAQPIDFFEIGENTDPEPTDDYPVEFTFSDIDNPAISLEHGEPDRQDVYKPVMSSRCSLYISDIDGVRDAFFHNVFDVAEFSTVVRIYAENTFLDNNDLYWKGFIVGDLYEDNVLTNGGDIEIVCNDGIKTLENTSFEIQSDVITEFKHIDLINRALEPIETESNEEAVVMQYSYDNSSNTTDRSASNIEYLTTLESFRIDDEENPFENNFEALTTILERHNVTLYQQSGQWIIRENYAIDDESLQFPDDATIYYAKSATDYPQASKLKNIGASTETPDILFLPDTPNRSGVQRYQTVVLTRNFESENWIANGGFEQKTNLISLFWDNEKPSFSNAPQTRWTAIRFDDTNSYFEDLTTTPDDERYIQFPPFDFNGTDVNFQNYLIQRDYHRVPKTSSDVYVDFEFETGASESNIGVQPNQLYRGDDVFKWSFATPFNVTYEYKNDNDETFVLRNSSSQGGNDNGYRIKLTQGVRGLDDVTVKCEPIAVNGGSVEGTELMPEGAILRAWREPTVSDRSNVDIVELTLNEPLKVGATSFTADVEDDLPKDTEIEFYYWENITDWENDPSPMRPRPRILSGYHNANTLKSNSSFTPHRYRVMMQTPQGTPVTGDPTLRFSRDIPIQGQPGFDEEVGVNNVSLDFKENDQSIQTETYAVNTEKDGRTFEISTLETGAGPVIEPNSPKSIRTLPSSFGGYDLDGRRTQIWVKYGIWDFINNDVDPKDNPNEYFTLDEWTTLRRLAYQGQSVQRLIFTFDVRQSDEMVGSHFGYQRDGNSFLVSYFKQNIGSTSTDVEIELTQHKNFAVGTYGEIDFASRSETGQGTNIVLDQRNIDGVSNWIELNGRPSGLFSLNGDSDGNPDTQLLDNSSIISALGYTPFDEKGGDIFGPVEVSGSLSVQGNTQVTGDLTVADELIAGLIVDPILGGDVQVSGMLTAQNDVTVQGNLTVLGTEFIANTQTVEISDNLAVINAGETGSGVTAGFAGWEVDRGTSTNFKFGFDESRSRFVVGQDLTTQVVATREDNPTNTGLTFYNSANNRFETSTGITWDGSILKVGTGSTRISDSDVDTGSILFTNNEQNNFSDEGRLFWDSSAGLYIQSNNADDGSTPRLQWSGDNFTAGKNVGVTYGSEDKPTLALNDNIDLSQITLRGEFLLTGVSTENSRIVGFDQGAWSGDIGVGKGKIEYHAEQWYMQSGDSSGAIVQFRNDSGNNASEVQRDGSFVTKGGVTVGKDVGSDHYVSQQTGYNISYEGIADFRSIFSDELIVQTFIAEQTQALSGSDFLTKSAADLDVDYNQGDPSIQIEAPAELQGAAAFEVGDVLHLREVNRSGGGLSVSDIWLEVSSSLTTSGDVQVYSITELQVPAGATVYRGSRVLNYGQPGDTIIERTVNGPGAPYDRIVTWQPDANGVPTTYTTISQIGNISDQTDADVGIYTESARFTNDIRIGDLSGSYLQFNQNGLKVVTAGQGDIDSAISTIQTDVSNNASSITALTSTQSDQGSAISALQLDVSNNADGISANSSLISQLDTDLGNVEAGLQTQINANETDISSNLQIINNLDTELGNVESGLQSQINANETDITSNLNLINTVQTDLGTVEAGLQSQIDANDSDISSNLQLINNLDTELGNVESGLQTQINANETDIQSNVGLINTLQTDTSTLSASLNLLTSAGRHNIYPDAGALVSWNDTFDTSLPIIDRIPYDIDPGSYLSLSVDLKTTSGTQSGRAKMRFTLSDGSAEDATFFSGQIIDQGWQTFTGTVQVPMDAVDFTVQFANDSGTVTDMQRQRVMLVRGQQPVPYDRNFKAEAAFDLAASTDNAVVGLEGRVTQNESDITANATLAAQIDTDTDNLASSLNLLTQTGRQNLLPDEAGPTSWTGGNRFLDTITLADVAVDEGDTLSITVDVHTTSSGAQDFIVNSIARNASGNVIRYLNYVPTTSVGTGWKTVQGTITIPSGTVTLDTYIVNQTATNEMEYRRAMLVRGGQPVPYDPNPQAQAAFSLAAQNETGLASVEGRVTDAEATLDQTVSYDGNTAGIFLTANGDGTALELDADQILLSGSVTADSIAAGTITADLINVTELAALNATIGGFDIANGALSTTTSGVEIALGSTDEGTSWATSVRGLQVGKDANNRIWVGSVGTDTYEMAVRENGDYKLRLGNGANNFIEGDLLVSGSVTADAIAAGTITANEINSNAVTADRIDVADLFAQSIDVTGTLSLDTDSEITNTDGAYSIGEEGISLNATFTNNPASAVRWFDGGTEVGRIRAFKPGFSGLELKSEELITSRTLKHGFSDPELGNVGQNYLEVKLPTRSSWGAMVLFSNTFNDLPNDFQVRQELEVGQAAIGAVKFPNGNINLLWLERDENDNVNIDQIF